MELVLDKKNRNNYYSDDENIDLIMVNIKENLRKLQLPHLYDIQKVITKQIQEVENSDRLALYMNMIRANLKIKEIYKIGGIGVVLELETISPGYVRCGFSYKIVNGNSNGNSNGNVIITIKSFENNFCHSEFEHPNNNIIANVKLSGCSLSDLQADMILEAK